MKTKSVLTLLLSLIVTSQAQAGWFGRSKTYTMADVGQVEQISSKNLSCVEQGDDIVFSSIEIKRGLFIPKLVIAKKYTNCAILARELAKHGGNLPLKITGVEAGDHISNITSLSEPKGVSIWQYKYKAKYNVYQNIQAQFIVNTLVWEIPVINFIQLDKKGTLYGGTGVL